ncbi:MULTISPECIES: sensor histidine kinase [unclassified Streptomyces]|uniref:sensor histidine kinase n=1 Tax=unclassified Streptomyces TaxID=2593676 RepID=UPI002286C801|nr:histidine kinase [Streptomyces sp. Je 1-369]WAL95501.1 histidine kinase [Streptomyces sp. Je 1-369]
MRTLPAVQAIRQAAATAGRLGGRWSREPRALDVLTALSAFALMSLDVPGLAEADNSLNGPLAALALAGGACSLLVRRRAPWLTYAVALCFLGWLHELTLAQFALYSLGRYRGRLAGAVGVVGYVAFAYVMFNLPGWPVHRGDTLGEFSSLVVPIGVLAAGVGVAANRQDLVRALEARRVETETLHAVQRERVRIARDVHDFVGRELTLLSVRSQVLARRAGGGPFEDGFEELSETARSAHRMLNEIIVQRGTDGAPTPGLAALPELAERSGRAGSPVDLVVDDAAHSLSPLRQAAVHRVVQECLTNAAKHAPGERVSVRVTLDGGRLHITVTNPLPTAAPPAAPVSAGTGTTGMAERIRAVGGTFEAGPRASAYEVRATLSTGETA